MRILLTLRRNNNSRSFLRETAFFVAWYFCYTDRKRFVSKRSFRCSFRAWKREYREVGFLAMPFLSPFILPCFYYTARFNYWPQGGKKPVKKDQQTILCLCSFLSRFDDISDALGSLSRITMRHDRRYFPNFYG